MDLISSSVDWFLELEMEETARLIQEHEWEVETTTTAAAAAVGGFSEVERPAKQRRREAAAAGSRVISFGVQKFEDVRPKKEPICDVQDAALMEVSVVANRSGCRRSYGVSSSTASNVEHVEAERKRREKLTQRFVQLSSLLPGLKKMDKASVLAEAARYVNELQEQVKALEQSKQASQTTSLSSALTEDQELLANSSSSSSSPEETSDHPTAPQIKVRFSERDVLINLHFAGKQGTVAGRVLDEIQKLHLHVISSSAVPFGRSAMDITVVAQMDDQFSATAEDLVKFLGRSL